MNGLQVTLFGRMSVMWAGQEVAGLEAKKVQELLAYLLVSRSRTHTREALAELLWGDRTPAQSRKYLRQALWQLQSALDSASTGGGQWLDVDPEWIRLEPSPALWLDVAEMEQAYLQAQGTAGGELDDARTRALEHAAQLYQGDFLDGCYQDWCIFERERLQNIYLSILDKLAQCCEVRQRYEAGLAYGAEALRYDRARERTHRRMMRLYYLAGDRTGALRQFDQLVATLKAELDVTPSQRSILLWEQIRADYLEDTPPSAPGGRPSRPELDRSSNAAVKDALQRLRQLQITLAAAQRQVLHEITLIEFAASES